MTYRELSSDLGITDPNFQLSRLFGVTRTFTFTCSHCFSPFLQHAARFLRFIWMHPFPVWPVPTIQSLVCTTIYMNPSSPYEEMVTSHSPCFRPWYSLKSSPREWICDPPAIGRVPPLTHSASFREGENRDSSGTTKEEEDSLHGIFCTGEPALPGVVDGHVVVRSAQ